MEQLTRNTIWFESPSIRMSAWRDFRKNLDNTSIPDMCATVVDWWATAPTMAITIDPVDSTNWPTAWELLNYGEYCNHSIALGMAYTIFYVNPDIPNKIVYLTDRTNSVEALCVVIDDKYLLNYEYGTVHTIPSGVEVSFTQIIDDLVKNRKT